MSGATSFEQVVVELRCEPPVQVLLMLVTIGAGGDTVDALTEPGNTACGCSIDTPYETALFQSPTKRICGLRNQSKPTTYCASIVSGTVSLPGSAPTRLWVKKLQA